MRHYLSLVKFSHTLFAMPFALIGFTLGYIATHNKLLVTSNYWITKLFLVILCMITARNAAMAFNRYIDKKYDKLNPRTAIREIPSGIITEKNAFLFVLINCLIFILATYFINSLCFLLSPIALLVVLGYSFTKRFTFLCHLILGVGLALAPIGSYIAVTAKFNIIPILLGIAVLFWVAGFDIIYALQDEAFDKQQQLYSIPSYFGQRKAIWIARIFHCCCFVLLLITGIIGNFKQLYFIGCALFLVLLCYQHYIVIRYGLQKINLAFFTTNGIASILFACLVIIDILML